jgi:Mn2+/Fe2+ NRAMP family transporter
MIASLSYRLLSMILVLNLSATCVGQLHPIDSTTVHDKIESRGLGKSIRVEEINGATVAGTILAVDADSFQVKPKHGGQIVLVRNDEVRKVQNGGLRTSIEVTIIVVVTFILVGAIVGTRV